MKKKRILQSGNRLDATGVALLCAVLGVALTAAVPRLRASGDEQSDSQSSMTSSAAPERITLDKKFKGKLPITELTEDEAILHALNRLAYGPRPGDVERVRQMGLEKWIDQQLHPESIDDAALESAAADSIRRWRCPRTSLLDEFPPPDQAAKAAGRNQRTNTGARCSKSGATRMAQMIDHRQRKSRQGAAAARETARPESHHRRALHGQSGPRRLQPAPARSGDGRFLVQPFQCLREQGRGQVAAHRLRARHDSPAHHGQVSGFAASPQPRARRCFSISTTG